MAKIFLRSGSLDAVLALGENGQPVFLSALQLRETLRLRKQQQIADCLAIPQPNDAGDRLDWYSPIPGKVTSWAAASESVRSQALQQLEACQQAVSGICQRAQLSEKPGQKLFGALLAKAIQFPDRNFVYLVGGKPVITFWGFVSPGRKNADALDCLRETLEAEPPLVLSKVAAPLETVTAPVVAASVTAPAEVKAAAESEPAAPANEAIPVPAAPAPSARPGKAALLRYGWTLPAAALLITLGIQLKGCVSSEEDAVPSAELAKPAEPAPEVAAAPAAPSAKPEAEVPVTSAQPEVVESAEPVSVPEPVPPVAEPVAAPLPQEAVPEVSPTEASSEPVTQPVQNIPVAKDDLVMPALSVKLGSTKFLNGSWRVIVHIKNPLTGKPPSLRYKLKDGKGEATMTQGDGSVCRVDVYAGLMQSGNLVINSRTKAKCSDGSRYQMPELVCRQGPVGPAECSGQYNADTVLPMTMKRESK